MNKKFFTLLVAFLTTISLQAFAELESVAVGSNSKFESTKTYLLGTGHTAGGTAGKFIYVKTENGQPVLKLGDASVVLGTDNVSLAELRSYMWNVTVTAAGSNSNTPIYTFVNVGTGVVLTMDAENAVRYDKDADGTQWAGENYEAGESNRLGGDIAEWIPSTLVTNPGKNVFYVYDEKNANKAIVLGEFESTGNIVAKKIDVTAGALTTSALETAGGLALTAYTVKGERPLTVNELNTQLESRGVVVGGSVKATLENFFNFTIEPDNTVESPITHTLQARAVKRMEIAFGKDGSNTNHIFYMDNNPDFDTQNAPTADYEPTQKGAAHFISMYLKGTELDTSKKQFVTDKTFSDGSLKITDAVRDELDTWYTLYSKEAGKYLVVDTIPFDGTQQAGNTLYGYTVDNLYNAKDSKTRYRNPDSYLFKVMYNPANNSITLISKAYVTGASTSKSKKEWVKATTDNAVFFSGSDNPTNASTANGFGKGAVKAGSYHPNYDYTTAGDATIVLEDAGRVQFFGGNDDPDDGVITNRVVLTYAKLVGETVYTLGSKSDLSVFKLGVNAEYITKPLTSGLYLLKVVGSSDVNRIGKYWKYSLGGKAQYVDREKRQNFQYIPSAQWVVERSGSSSYPSVKITNREFGNYNNVQGKYEGAGLGNGITYRVKDKNGAEINNQFFFFGGDTIEFEAVTDKSATLGYKDIKFPDDFDPTIYVFKYLHELAMDKPVNTINDKDSALWVSTDDDQKISFRIEKVKLDDKYGYVKSYAPQLTRNVYKIKVYQAENFNVVDSYVTYNATSRKFYLTKNSDAATNFFLKENNRDEVTGIPYYTFVIANMNNAGLAKVVLNEDKDWVAENDKNKDPIKGFVQNEANFFGEDWMLVEGIRLSEDGSEVWKENGTEKYYPFVPKEYPYTAADPVKKYRLEDGKSLIYARTEGGNDIYYRIYPSGYHFNSGGELFYRYEADAYATGKVSVDGNSLSLVFGVLDDSQGSQVANSAFSVDTDGTRIYRYLGDGDNPEEKTDVNIVKFYQVRNTAARAYLYEDANSEHSLPVNGPDDETRTSQINFLGIEGKGMNENAPMIVRNVTGDVAMPQYIISVDEENVPAVEELCPFCQGKDPECTHSTFVREHIKGRFLINLKDSVDYYTANPSKGSASKFQSDNSYSRLAFVDGKLYDDNTLVIANSVYTGNTNPIDWDNKELTWASKDTINLGNKHEYNPVKFSFRLVDNSTDKDFFIESESWKDKNAWEGGIQPTNGGWIKIQNGVPVIVNAPTVEDYRGAEIFNIDLAAEGEEATSNTGIEEGKYKVTAGTGTVTIEGAANKQAVVTNILGKVVANVTLGQDYETIPVPAGVVIVSVDGEATKALVK